MTPQEMAAIDAGAPEPVHDLVERAGARVARAARQMLGGVYARRVTVVAGPGNNGADSIVAARLLAQAGVRVVVVDPAERLLPTADLVIDGAFGTGMNRAYAAADTTAPVLAIDIPSGVDGLTGELHGTPMSAQRTITFAALKPGLLLHPGAAHTGHIEIASIGLDVSSARSWLLTRGDAARLVPRRAATDHKWKRAVHVIGGSHGMVGAPRLAADAALRAGAGLVRCGLPGADLSGDRSEVIFESLPAADWAEPVLAGLSGRAHRTQSGPLPPRTVSEPVSPPPVNAANKSDNAVDPVVTGAHLSAQAVSRFHALVIGPGLAGGDQDLRTVVAEAPTDLAIVVDGAGLRMLGDRPQLRSNVVLTPHDGEFAAIAGAAPSADRFKSARELAADTGATVLLKGPLTIVAAPDGRCLSVGHGDARLATAGSGDVLSGVIGALLAAGLSPLNAAAMGAWVHADAGHQLPAIGGIASDLLAGVAHSMSALALT